MNWLERIPGAMTARGRAAHGPERGLLREMRSLNVASCSDLELRDTIAFLAHEVQDGQAESSLPMVFGVVNESISRRQGAWRFFNPADPEMETQGLERYHQLADHVAQTLDYQRAADGWVDAGNKDWESFDLAVAMVMDRQRFDSRDRILVQTILHVRQRSQAEYTANILLPACFYQAVRESDQAGALEFQATDEQILAGILLYQGKIVEMNAGEGKTVAAVFPSVLHAVHGRTVHVITANDYLASRDAEWLAPIYDSLGVSVGAVLDVMDDSERRHAYGKGVVYGALREFGFDYMRDNLKLSSAETVQRKLDVAIVDEADHALIDEANVPLIISGGAGAAPKIPGKLRAAIEQLIDLHHAAVLALEQELSSAQSESQAYFLILAKLFLADPESAAVRNEFAAGSKCHKRVLRVIAECRVDGEYDNLTGDLCYWIDDDGRSICLTGKGQDFIESRLGPLFDDLSLPEQISGIQASPDLPLALRRKETGKLTRQLVRRQEQMHQVVRMLWGYVLLKRDSDYLVRDGRVVLIDRYTGRGRPDTRYHFGLQAAIEVKEGVPVQPEHEVLGRISVRGFLSQYGAVCGMTGTAMYSKSEFERAYGLEVVAVPPSNAIKRTDLEPRMYFSKQDKLRAIVEEVRFCHQVGRPVLIGAHSIDECDVISGMLLRDGIKHNLLNAANDLEEDRIVVEAGLFGAVTVATDMAGRGTDIILETGSDLRIAEGYAKLLGELLADGLGVVTLRCPNQEAAQILLSALDAESPGYSLATDHHAEGTDVIVSAKHAASDSSVISLDFGLGLYVIGAGNSDNARVDHQLMGRSGRQGDFGASRFFSSSEDRLLRFGGDARPVSAGPAGESTDLDGRGFREGAALTRHLEKIQKGAERDAASRRERAEDYSRVLEAQSFDYYRTRKDLLGMEDFQPFLHRLVVGKAGQLAQKHFPDLLVDDYADQFSGLLEELELDYNVAASGLWGLDLNLLASEIAILIESRLAHRRERFTADEFGKLGKLLYLQTGDELWRDHMTHVQSLILGTQLLGHNGRGDLAAYTLISFESYDDFQARIMDSFLPRLAAFPSDSTGEPQPPRLELFEDVFKILG